MSNQPNITLQDIEASANSLALLGHVITYRLMGIRVQEPELRAALEAAGFAEHMPALPTPRKALRRALEAWIAVRTGQRGGARAVAATAPLNDEEEEDDQKQRTLIRVINRPGAEHLVFGIVSEDVDFTSLGLSYGTQLRILLHKKTGQILCTTDARGVISAENESIQVTSEIAPYWAQFRTLFFSEDLSKMVRSIISGMQAVSLRREGGVYFVPESQRRQIEMARSLLGQLPTSGEEQPFLCAVPVPDVEASKGQLARAVHYGFMDEIRAMSADLEHFVAAAPGTVRLETISNRLQQYKQVKEKVGMYATLLSMQQTNILKELETLTERARAVVVSSPSKAKGGTRSGGNSATSPAARRRMSKSKASSQGDESASLSGSAGEERERPIQRRSTTTQVLAAAGVVNQLQAVRSAPGLHENLKLFF